MQRETKIFLVLLLFAMFFHHGSATPIPTGGPNSKGFWVPKGFGYAQTPPGVKHYVNQPTPSPLFMHNTERSTSVPVLPEGTSRQDVRGDMFPTTNPNDIIYVQERPPVGTGYGHFTTNPMQSDAAAPMGDFNGLFNKMI